MNSPTSIRREHTSPEVVEQHIGKTFRYPLLRKRPPGSKIQLQPRTPGKARESRPRTRSDARKSRPDHLSEEIFENEGGLPSPWGRRDEVG